METWRTPKTEIGKKAKNWLELKTCGWFGVRLENIQSRPKLTLEVASKTCQNDFKFHICGWFEVGIENIQSDPSKDVRGQSWPRNNFFWWVRLKILNSNPKPSTNVKFEVILTCFWSDLQGQLWPLTSLGRSDWIFSNIIPNHPQVCNLKSFWHVFEVTSKVNFGLWPLLVGQIEYSSFKLTWSRNAFHVFWSFF